MSRLAPTKFLNLDDEFKDEVDEGVNRSEKFFTDSDAGTSSWNDLEGYIRLIEESVSANISSHSYQVTLDNGTTVVSQDTFNDLKTWIDSTITLSTTKYSIRTVTSYSTSNQFGSVTLIFDQETL